jgi:hypothetical protein
MPDLPFITDTTGEVRFLGCLPTSPVLRGEFPEARDVIEIIPRSDWKEVSWEHMIQRVYDQNAKGSCGAEMGGQITETGLIQCGQPHVPLSPGNLYGRVNGGRDQGSTLGDNLNELMERGICTENIVPHLAWERWDTPGWREEAIDYRILEVFLCPDFDAIASAILRGLNVGYGIMIGNNFAPDSEGWIPDYQGGGGGHAMMGCGLRKRRDGAWGIRTINSWGTRWGHNGFCIVPETYFTTYHEDAWCARAIVHKEQVLPEPFHTAV